MEEPVPTYQYACTACQHQLEAVQSFSDDPLTQCPVCDGKLRKLFGSVGIVFKGPGFYRTDSRAGSSGSDNGSKPGANGSSGDGTAGKDKPASKEKPASKDKSDSGGSASTGKTKTASTSATAST